MAESSREGAGSAVQNATSYAPSARDLLLAVPRLAQRAGAIAFYYIPEQFDGFVGKAKAPGSVIAERTTDAIQNTTITGAVKEAILQATSTPESAAGMAGQMSDGGDSLFSFQNIRSIGGFFTYLTSKWALATFTVAIILNRTQVYASSRVPLSFKWHVRLALYILPLLAFASQTVSLLQALRCQSSPDWNNLRYGDSDKKFSSIDFGGEGGFLHYLSSVLLFWQNDRDACAAAGMTSPDYSLLSVTGSLSRLWPLFLTLCVNQFIETLACALQGQKLHAENGMTLFEHSLAFAEAEAMITKPFNLKWRISAADAHDDEEKLLQKLTRSKVLRLMNVPPEVLLIALISSLSHLSSSTLAVLGIRSRFRLVNTGFWGLAYMGAFMWSFVRLNLSGEPTDIGILRFPTVCIVGFIPHLLILAGILACAMIYGLALTLSIVSPPPGVGRTATLKDRVNVAYQNLQANLHLSTGTPLNWSWQDDFYSALLKVGFAVLTAASEAVYLNEGVRIRVSPLTWLEEKRLEEITERRARTQRAVEAIPGELRGDSLADGVGSYHDEITDLSGFSTGRASGYLRERKPRKAKADTEVTRAATGETGVGFMQRHGRWQMTFQFAQGIFVLIGGACSRLLLAMLQKLGITHGTEWLRRSASVPGDAPRNENMGKAASWKPMDFWMVSDQGELKPADENVDVESETRRRLIQEGQLGHGAPDTDETLNDHLYGWWKFGGWWGEQDRSGDFQPREQEDDSTSMVSMTTNDSNEWSDENDDGRRTPTQERPDAFTREPTPAMDDLLDTSRLATLLDPQNPDQQAEARMLSRHLQSDRIMTRAQYRRNEERQRMQLLTRTENMSPEEEERALEQFIIQRRQGRRGPAASGEGGTWNTGAEGMGDGGPQCVVCQCSPRTILVWPCGCLSMCDDCRVGLAGRNFTSCICCRGEIVAYSRLYVP